MKTQPFLVGACLVLSAALTLAQESSPGKGSNPPLKKIVIEEQPVEQLVKYGQSVHFNIRAALKGEGGPVRYQWTHNFLPIEGATRPTLLIGKVSRSDLGVYACVVSTQHDAGHDQPEVQPSELVSLVGYSKVGNAVVVEGFFMPLCEFKPEVVPFKGPNQKASNNPRHDLNRDTDLLYAMNDRGTLSSGRNSGSAPLYFGNSSAATPLYFASSIQSTQSFTVYPVGPVGGAGPAALNSCPPAYKCYFNFRKTVSPFGWLPSAGTATGKAKHLQAADTIVKWFVGTQSSGCGTGEVNITFSNPNNVYRFTVYCPSSSYSTCLTGVQQLELTGFQE
jgi:hypothetical protein